MAVRFPPWSNATNAAFNFTLHNRPEWPAGGSWLGFCLALSLGLTGMATCYYLCMKLTPSFPRHLHRWAFLVKMKASKKLAIVLSPNYHNSFKKIEAEIGELMRMPKGVLFLRPSSSVDPFVDVYDEPCVYPVELHDYSGIHVPCELLQQFRAIAVYSRKTGYRVPLSVDDTSSSPTRTLLDCVKASNRCSSELRPMVYLLIDGVLPEEHRMVETLVDTAWEDIEELRDVSVMCFDGKLSQNQQTEFLQRDTGSSLTKRASLLPSPTWSGPSRRSEEPEYFYSVSR